MGTSETSTHFQRRLSNAPAATLQSKRWEASAWNSHVNAAAPRTQPASHFQCWRRISLLHTAARARPRGQPVPAARAARSPETGGAREKLNLS